VHAPTVVRGSPQTIADYMEEWFRKRLRRFNIMPPFLPGGCCDDFVELVIRGTAEARLFRTEYESQDLREILGLKRPGSTLYMKHRLKGVSAPRVASGG